MPWPCLFPSCTGPCLCSSCTGPCLCPRCTGPCLCPRYAGPVYVPGAIVPTIVPDALVLPSIWTIIGLPQRNWNWLWLYVKEDNLWRSHYQIFLPSHLEGWGRPTFGPSWMHMIYTLQLEGEYWDMIFDVLRYHSDMIVSLFTLLI